MKYAFIYVSLVLAGALLSFGFSFSMSWKLILLWPLIPMTVILVVYAIDRRTDRMTKHRR